MLSRSTRCCTRRSRQLGDPLSPERSIRERGQRDDQAAEAEAEPSEDVLQLVIPPSEPDDRDEDREHEAGDEEQITEIHALGIGFLYWEFLPTKATWCAACFSDRC